MGLVAMIIMVMTVVEVVNWAKTCLVRTQHARALQAEGTAGSKALKTWKKADMLEEEKED